MTIDQYIQNETQYFADVPLLKDHRTRTLCFDDILHYQKIIVALFETGKIMREIDK